MPKNKPKIKNVNADNGEPLLSVVRSDDNDDGDKNERDLPVIPSDAIETKHELTQPPIIGHQTVRILLPIDPTQPTLTQRYITINVPSTLSKEHLECIKTLPGLLPCSISTPSCLNILEVINNRTTASYLMLMFLMFNAPWIIILSIENRHHSNNAYALFCFSIVMISYDTSLLVVLLNDAYQEARRDLLNLYDEELIHYRDKYKLNYITSLNTGLLDPTLSIEEIKNILSSINTMQTTRRTNYDPATIPPRNFYRFSLTEILVYGMTASLCYGGTIFGIYALVTVSPCQTLNLTNNYGDGTVTDLTSHGEIYKKITCDGTTLTIGSEWQKGQRCRITSYLRDIALTVTSNNETIVFHIDAHWAYKKDITVNGDDDRVDQTARCAYTWEERSSEDATGNMIVVSEHPDHPFLRGPHTFFSRSSSQTQDEKPLPEETPTTQGHSIP